MCFVSFATLFGLIKEIVEIPMVCRVDFKLGSLIPAATPLMHACLFACVFVCMCMFTCVYILHLC